MPLTEHPDVNALAFCDCSNHTFRVGIEARPNGENYIRVLECCECDKQMRVPFHSAPSPPSLPSPNRDGENDG